MRKPPTVCWLKRAILHDGHIDFPGGRGMGEPLRLMTDLPNEAEIVALSSSTARQ
jgi:hypothetical protein